MRRNLFVTAAVLGLAAPAPAQPAPKKGDDKALVTKVYDLRPLLGDRGKAGGVADVDAVVKLILETVPLGEAKPGADGPQLVEREGGRLEVRVTAEDQGAVADLIEALKRLADVAVDVKAEVFELDPAAFDKLTKALPKEGKGKPGSPVLFAGSLEFERPGEGVSKALEAGRVVQASEGRFANGAEATLSARLAVRTFRPVPLVKLRPPADNPFQAVQSVKEGFKLVGVPVVSGDRRFVRLKLTEQSVAVAGFTKRELGEFRGHKIVGESPDLEDLGATGSAVVADGGALLFRLAYAPKDKVWVVVLRPTIFIQSEEDARKPKGSR